MVQGVFPSLEMHPAPSGLFSVARVVRHDSADSWENGPYAWDTDACPAQLILADFCASAAQGAIVSVSGVPSGSMPFGVVSVFECVSVGMSSDRCRNIAAAQVEAGSQKAVEAELWSGHLAQASGRLETPYLSNGQAVDVTGGAAVRVIQGIAKLEQGLADCGLGTAGVLHLTRQVAQLAGGLGALQLDALGVLRTALGTPVVAGVGYDPAVVPETPAVAPMPAPATLGHRPDKQWGYATGPLVVHLGPVDHFGVRIDTATNMMQTKAGRTGAAYWDSCCVVAVQIDTTL